MSKAKYPNIDNVYVSILYYLTNLIMPVFLVIICYNQQTPLNQTIVLGIIYGFIVLHNHNIGTLPIERLIRGYKMRTSPGTSFVGIFVTFTLAILFYKLELNIAYILFGSVLAEWLILFGSRVKVLTYLNLALWVLTAPFMGYLSYLSYSIDFTPIYYLSLGFSIWLFGFFLTTWAYMARLKTLNVNI